MEIVDLGKRRLQRHKQPVAMVVVDRHTGWSDETFSEAINKAIGDFFRTYDNTHVIDEPKYIIADNGTERLILFGTCKAYALEKIGFAAEVAATQQHLGQTKFQKLAEAASAAQVAVAPPGSTPPPGGPKPLRGAFGATERR